MFEPWFVELVSVVKDILVSLSAIVVAVLGFLGLRQWRAELTGRARFEVARRAVLLALRYKDEFQQARHPATFASESEGRPRDDSEDLERRQILDEWYARRERLRPLREMLLELSQVRWEARVILGDDLQEFVWPLRVAFSKLSVEVQEHFSYRTTLLDRPWGDDADFLARRVEASRLVIYSAGDDDLSGSVDTAVEALEQHLGKYVRRRSVWAWVKSVLSTRAIHRPA